MQDVGPSKAVPSASISRPNNAVPSANIVLVFLELGNTTGAYANGTAA